MANTHVVTVTTTHDFPTGAAADMSNAPLDTLRRVGTFIQSFASGELQGTTTIDLQVGTAASTASSATLTFTSVGAGNVVSINGVRFRAVTGTPVRTNNEFKVGVSNTADAADFVATLSASTDARISGVVTATAASGVVTLTSVSKGALANALTVETLGVVATQTVTYSSSSGTETVTINGVAITATAGATDTLTATAVAAAINASANALVKGHVTATSAAGVVTVYAVYPGPRGNAITLTASGTGATAGGSGRLTGGALAQGEGAQATGTVTIASGSGNYTVTINGVNASGTVAYNTSDTQTASDIADAINKSQNALVAGIISATASAGVVTITADRGGISGNAITLACTGTGATASGTRLTGGATATQVALGGNGSQFASGAMWRLGGGAGLAGASVSSANALTI